jgi:DNA-binding MarR family transcriptional regulator
MPTPDIQRRLLEAIEQNPDTTQAGLAAQLGVAVGSVNWYMKRLIRKGYVKVTHLQRRKLKYFLTPQGLALKARLTSQYMEASLRLYRELRRAAQDTLSEVDGAGYRAVYLAGDGDAAEIFRLTCLERGVGLATGSDDMLPQVAVDGADFVVQWPEQASHGEKTGVGVDAVGSADRGVRNG